MIIALSMIIASSYAETQEELNYKPGELIIRFKSDKGKPKTINEKQAFVSKKSGGKIKKSYRRFSDLCVIELPKNLKVKDALIKYKDSKEILYVEPNYKVKINTTIPNDPYFSQLWGLQNTGQEHPVDGGGTTYGTEGVDIDAPEAWDISTGSQDIIVAVIDTGVDYTHPDLSANMWVNQAELVGDPNSDDDGNGYKDDIYGYDFANNDGDPNDDHFHGTHCAGTIGAIGNNGIGVAGVCWSVKIMALKFLDSGGYGYTDDAIECIEYAVDNGAKVLNNSWGGGSYSQSLKEAIEDAEDAGVIFVAAAGNNIYDAYWNVVLNNDTYPHYPSSYDCDNIIAVMATDDNDARSRWNAFNESHYGLTSVDIAAPGSDILSTFPTYMTSAMQSYGLSTDYETIGGTSMATPHVSGTCALIWSMYPYLRVSEVKQIVIDSAEKLDSLDNLCVTEGRLNLYQALLHAYPMELEIVDDIAEPSGCVIPGDDITFTITYSNPSVTNPSDPNYFGPAYDAEIVFPRPEAIDPNLNHPNYNMFEDSFIWDIGTLNPGDSNSISLTVTVNQNAEPLGEIKSKVKMYSSIGYGEDQEVTRVCCWGGTRIYVNAYATGSKTGVTWDNAYTDLQDALQRAGNGCGTEEIWVAQGIYRPTKTHNQNASFDMVDDLELYGGFKSDANSLNDRDFVKYKTYLSGNIDVGGDLNSFIVVNTEPEAEISSDTTLDGFIITHSTVAGIYCNEADMVIQNCVITDNDANGINIYKSDPYIFDSVITDNGAVGVYDCNESLVTIEGCIISKNGGNGISCRKNAAVTLKNSWIHNNGSDGIGLTDAASGSVIRNNTIVYNQRNGINAESGYAPTVKNSIVWGNEITDLSGCSATYSCFDGGTGTNIDVDPNFVCIDPDIYNYHLRYGSPCRNTGDGYYPDEYDIDGEPREYGSEIDRGADEIYCTDGTLGDDDVFHALDWNSDGLVNMHEYSYFSAAWLSHDPNDPAFDPNDVDYNPNLTDPNSSEYIDPNQLLGWYEWKYMCNLQDDGDSAYQIDLADLEAFLNDWLWKADYVRFDTWLHTFGEIEGDTDEMYGSQTSTAMTLNIQQPTPIVVEEKTIEEQYTEIQEISTFLENLWNEDPTVQEEIDEQQWTDFMNQIYDWMDTLESQL